MKKYFDWFVEGIILSAMSVAFVFVVGDNRSDYVYFGKDWGMFWKVAIFAWFVALALLVIKKETIKYRKIFPAIYALENLIIYYVASSYSCSEISYEGLFFAVYANLKVYHFLIKKCTTSNRLQSYI